VNESHVGWFLAGGAVAAGLLLWKRDTPRPGRPALSPVDDVLALARTITSEAGDGTPAEREMVGWVVRNRARAAGVSIQKLVCQPECGPCCQGRPFSSARSPAAADLGLAMRVLVAPASGDPTGGATSFFEPALQDKWVAEGRPGYKLTASQVRDRWRKEGLVPVATIGRFETWRKGG
jgi:hypothetical protein